MNDPVKPAGSPAPTGSAIRAISIRQPWAWLILHAGKDIENRNWSRKITGRVLIHASGGMTRDEYDSALAFATSPRRLGPAAYEWLPAFDDLERGGIVGEVEILRCVSNSISPWFEGPFGFVLSNPKPLPFQPCRGKLGFFVPNAQRSATGAVKGQHE